MMEVTAERLEGFAEPSCQLAGGHEHQHPRCTMTAPVRLLLVEALSNGSANAAVLPVPVWAAANRSRPSCTAGMAAAG